MGKNISEIKVFAFNNCSSLTEIEYAGTIEDWNNINKVAVNDTIAWNSYCPEITVHCTDGDVIVPAN